MPTTPKGEAARRRIVEVAWDLSHRRGVEQVLSGVTLREVARAAEMSPSAVSYHFPTMRDLAMAMVETLLDGVSLAPVESIEAFLADAHRDGLATTVRLAAQTDWDSLNSDDELRFERRLLRCRGAVGDHADGAELRGILSEGIDRWFHAIADIYERTAAKVGVRPIEPFTYLDVARAAGAITIGMLHASMVDDDAVRPGLVGDLLVAFASAVLVPAPRLVDVAEISTALPRPPRERRDGEDEIAADLRAAELVAPLVAAGEDGVTLTQVARVLGWGPEEVAERFGSVRAVAALSFRRHLDDVVAAAARRADRGHEIALADGVYELARAVLADRHCALALLRERQDRAMQPLFDASGRHRGPPEESRDVRRLVPLAEPLVAHLSALTRAAPDEVADLAELIVDTVLGHGATHPRLPLSELTEIAVRLVPRD